MRLNSPYTALVLGFLALPIATASGVPGSAVSAQPIAFQETSLEALETWSAKLVGARKPAARDAAFQALVDLAEDDERAEEVLSRALTQRWTSTLTGLGSAKLEKKFGRLISQREKLDVVRKAALSLIEDETKYFYPYRQPDVSAEKAAQYHEVQEEVSKRVRELEDVWGKSLRVKLPKAAKAALEEMEWLRSQEEYVADGLSVPKSLPVWIPLLPTDIKQIDLASFPVDAKEAARMLRDRKVALYNDRVWEACVDPKRTKTEEDQRLHARFPGKAEREQVRVSNRYRNMMGRPSLTWDPLLQEAAHLHSEYQTRTGEFGHFQKIPETRTPFDRMRLAGYRGAKSENCAKGASDPAGAHANWMRSSGHHRNIIMDGHMQMASAVSGDVWTQNYGIGRSAEHDL